MSFYTSIARYYEDIFPYDSEQLDFIRSSTDCISDKRVLDIGCGTGALTSEVGNICRSIIGVDLDSEMIAHAKKRERGNLSFKRANMLNLADDLGGERFDIIFTLGNTLVHLKSKDQMLEFLKSSHSMINDGGKILVQILNYDRILDKNIESLPLLENERIRFERRYQKRSDGRISFQTELLAKGDFLKVKNSIDLYPLRQSELEALMREAGFADVKSFGSFRRDPVNAESFVVVSEGTK